VDVNFHVERVLGNLFLLRVDDARVRFFEALWEIPEGVTYNAYLLTTEEGAVLFDGWKQEFSDAFVEALQRLIDPRDIRAVVTHHTEPDHSGTTGKLAEVAPRALFVGHPIAGRILRSHFGVERFKPLMDGEALELGGYRIRAVHTPWLHWPDSIVTSIEGEGVLLTCDVFGSYSIPPLFDDQADLAKLSRSIRKYIITVIGHYIDWIPKGIEKVSKAVGRPRIIAPGHGVVYRSNPQWVVEEYLRVASGQPVKGKVVLTGLTMYGNVGKAMETVREEMEANGWRAVYYGFNDKERPPISEVLTDASDAELLIIGTPVYEAQPHPIIDHLIKLIAAKLPHRKSMPILILASYGWSPGATGKHVSELLIKQGFSRVMIIDFEGAQLKPSIEDELQALIAR